MIILMLCCTIVVNAVSNFANIRMSALYFDIMKDCLYADSVNNMERRSVVQVLRQVISFLEDILINELKQSTRFWKR